ncbi:sensor histidine kinase [Paenibacillus sp. J2TS4]|uniref:sensor histidine kinase n=1 Tax=Paenibacillus sp. J2TS4 TaxID=2807194 RepID=UPI001B2DB7A0|nr:histidine kinase [Paenibacillus sp. J2TS4]GIP34664.1 histidine kinase [Paenibacillus sp. J2TS4]
MMNPLRRMEQFPHKPRSLKTRLITGLVLSSIVPLLLLGAVSYYVIYHILDNKTANSIRSTLHQVSRNMEQAYDNLNYVSQQLASRDQQLLFLSDDPAEKYVLSQRIFEHLQLVGFTNPDTGLFYIFNPETNDLFYANQPVKAEADGQELPVMSQYKGVTYHAPHSAFAAHEDALVLSVSRPLNIVKRSPQNIYVESNKELYGQLLNTSQYGMDVVHIVTDKEGKVVFSQDGSAFPLGTVLAAGDRDNVMYETLGDYYFFAEHSAARDWSIYTLIHKSIFQKEVWSWTMAWLGIALLSLLLSVAIAGVIWRMVYFPLRKLNLEIRRFGNNGLDKVESREQLSLTHVVEFDILLKQFQEMRSKIWALMAEVKQQEEDKRHLEVEKVIAQINPHFLYNTLNTVQWIAKARQQDEIVQLVTVFIRLLRYNLGKDGGMVRLRNEIDALQDYVSMQQIRYNHEFSVKLSADDQALDALVPRFLLQPLIENALYHGLTGENSSIELAIKVEQGAHILVQITDNGVGMTEEEIEALLVNDIPERDKIGMGIGLNYVNTMLKAHFGETSRLQAASSPEQGTTMFFRIPLNDDT